MGLSAWHQHNVHQGVLESQLRLIFPSLNTLKNIRKEVALKNPITGGYLEVDIWIPNINLCFEFQDDYHYKTAWYSHMPLASVQQKDNIKRNQLLKRGLTLVVVPYWWDGNAASLQGTIYFHRPDLVSPKDVEIPANPPFLFFRENKQLMLASFPDETIAHNLMDRKAWWVGEKWDGVRCLWDSAENKLYSRHDLRIDLHPSVNDIFGYLVLDGELWCGRGFFHESQHFTTSTWARLNSAFMRLMCFDEASIKSQTRAFEYRYSLILSYLPPDHPTVLNAPRFLCKTEPMLLFALTSIIEGGGEGLILRKTNSPYIPGRNKSLLKIKASHSDQEALVLKVENNGALLLKLRDGYTFTVEQKDCLFNQRAVKGDVVTFSFDYSRRSQFTSIKDFLTAIPANPVVHCIRSDLSWDDVVHNPSQPIRWFANEKHQLFKANMKAVDVATVAAERYKAASFDRRYTAAQLRKLHSKRRAYMDKFAQWKGMDPLNPVFWYHTSARELRRYNPEIKNIIYNYGGRLSTTLVNLYPDIGLEKGKFKVFQSWKLVSQRKAYFDDFAESKGMDPLNPVFWSSITQQELLNYSFAYNPISKYYGYRLSTTLMSLYPNIGLRKSQFIVPQNWKLEKDRKAYFDKYAAYKGMDHFNPVFWYTVTQVDLNNYNPGCQRIIEFYGGELSTALTSIYPNIGLQKSLFKPKLLSWKKLSDRKAYFDKFAVAKGKNALDPNFWYSVTLADLASFNEAYRMIIDRYGGKLSTALLALYPDIGLQRERFKILQSWKRETDRRVFFDKFAISLGGDPLNPHFWYGINAKDIISRKSGYQTIAKYYDGKLHTVLMNLYPNIGLQESGFKVKKSWKDETARKAFFDNFAASRGMDPLNPDFWHRVSTLELLAYNKEFAAVRYYGTLPAILMQLYPNIGLQKSQFFSGAKM